MTVIKKKLRGAKNYLLYGIAFGVISYIASIIPGFIAGAYSSNAPLFSTPTASADGITSDGTGTTDGSGDSSDGSSDSADSDASCDTDGSDCE